MERVNNTIHGREKNYRGFKTESTPMLPLFIAYYNLVREHQAIRKTPVQTADIDLNLGNNKWIELIRSAYKKKNEQNDDEFDDLF